jgi:hypothetical protein
VEIPSRARQLLSEVIAADVQELGADPVGDAEDGAQDVHEPLLAIEAEQHARRTTDARLVNEQLHIHARGARVRHVGVGRTVQAATVLLERPLDFLRASALHVEDVIHDDAVEPRAKAASFLERRQPGDELDQDLLGCVFGILRQVHHPHDDVVDPWLVTDDELFEGLPASAANPAQQLEIPWIGSGIVAQRMGLNHGNSCTSFF